MSGAWGRGSPASQSRSPPVQPPPRAPSGDEDADLARALAESAQLAAAEAARPSAAEEEALLRRVLADSARAAADTEAAESAPPRPPPPPSSSFPSLPAVEASAGEVQSAEDLELRRAMEESARYAAGGVEEAGVTRALEESKQDLFIQQRRMLERFAAAKEAADREARAATARAEREAREAEGRARAATGAAGARPRRRRAVDASEVLGFYSEREDSEAGASAGCGYGFGAPRARGRGRGRGRGGRGVFGGSGRGHERGRGGGGGFGFEGGPMPGFGSGGADHRHRRAVSPVVEQVVPGMTVPRLGPDHILGQAVAGAVAEHEPVLLPTSRPLELQTAVSVSSSATTVNAILDGESLGLEYGIDRTRWDARGVELAFLYFRSRSHCVQVLLPEHYATRASPECASALARIEALDPGVLEKQEVTTTARTDLMLHAVNSSQIADAPPTVLVSNNTFYAQVLEQSGPMLQDCRNYLARFRIGFSWLQDELIPAPAPGMLGL